MKLLNYNVRVLSFTWVSNPSKKREQLVLNLYKEHFEAEVANNLTHIKTEKNTETSA